MDGDRQIRQRRSGPCPVQTLTSPRHQAVCLDPIHDPKDLTPEDLSCPSRNSLTSSCFLKYHIRLHQHNLTESQLHGGSRLPAGNVASSCTQLQPHSMFVMQPPFPPLSPSSTLAPLLNHKC